MKKIILSLTVALLSVGVLQAQPHGEIKEKISIEVIIGTRQPAPKELKLMRLEEKDHPNIAKAMHDIEAAMHNLHDAPDNFGGHKAQAEEDLQKSYVSLRRALYYRLYEDTH